jgi:hypothetical protein
MEVAMGVAHPPRSQHHNNRIPPDYTRVEVHTVKPEFMQWPIDHPTPDGQRFLGEVMNQFILWHKKDIVLDASSPPGVEQVVGVVEEGEILSPSRDHLPEMPQSSPPPRNEMPDMPQPFEPYKDQGPDAVPIHEQEGAQKEPHIREKIPITIRPIFTPIQDIALIHKWYAHDQFKPENQVKEVPPSDEALSRVRKPARRYPNVDATKWSDDCPKIYERGKPFLPNRDIQRLPLGMKRFHDWYLRVLLTTINIIHARFPPNTFGGPKGEIVFDFNDMQTAFHLGYLETNLIRTWCL